MIVLADIPENNTRYDFAGLNLQDLPHAGSPMSPALHGAVAPQSVCHRCAREDAFRPPPQLNGDLRVDPEIRLPSPGMDVDIAYFYNASESYNGPYGYGRT